MDFVKGKEYVIRLEAGHEFRDYVADHEFLVKFRGESKTGLLRFGICFWKASWGNGTISTRPEFIAEARPIPLGNYADTGLISRVIADGSGLSPERHDTTRIRGYHHVFGDYKVEPWNDGRWAVYFRTTREAAQAKAIANLERFGFKVSVLPNVVSVEVED